MKLCIKLLKVLEAHFSPIFFFFFLVKALITNVELDMCIAQKTTQQNGMQSDSLNWI